MEASQSLKPESKSEVSTSNKTQEDGYYPEEEITEGNWKTPNVEVKDIKIVTGEEDEVVTWSHRAKLYRWNDQQWKQRGVGEAKLLKHKTTNKIRFLLRQEKTLKIVANHYVLKTDAYCKLSLNSGSDRIWVWAALDYAEDHVQNEQFALRFSSVEQANEFKKKFEEASDQNTTIMNNMKKVSTDITSDKEQKIDKQDKIVEKEAQNKETENTENQGSTEEKAKEHEDDQKEKDES